MLILKIREESIRFSSMLKKTRNKTEAKLIKEIDYLEKLELNDRKLNLLENKKQELETIRQDILQGHLVRSRINWLNESEKPSKFLCALENKNYVEKTIKKVIVNEKAITNQNEILIEIRKFYINLFSNKDESLNLEHNTEIFSSLQSPVLSTEQSSKLDTEISIEEIGKVLKNMKNNKTPGIDGLN